MDFQKVRIEKSDTDTGIRYSPLDVAKYIFWTGDEKGVTSSIEEFLREDIIAREHGIRFMETSAKANINIERAFSELAEAIFIKTAGKEPGDPVDRVTVDRRPTSTTKSCCN